MLPNNHIRRKSIAELRDKIDELIIGLKEAKQKTTVLLEQEVLQKDDVLLNYVFAEIEKSDYVLKSINDYNRYKLIELSHSLQAKTAERTYRRDLAYSLFHRSFSSECQVIDLDFLEVRKQNGIYKPVLIYDVKMGQNLLKNIDQRRNRLLSMKVYSGIANQLNIPFWLVGYEPTLKYLDIYDIKNVIPLEYKLMRKTPLEYKGLIEAL
jgi:hypothetical protein